MKKRTAELLTILLLTVLLMVSTAGCSQKTPDSNSTPDDTGNVQIPNPWVDCATLDEAAKVAGFDIAIPGKFDGYPNKVYQAIENTMIQVMYYDGDPDDEGSKMVMVRKGTGDDDISGDYNEYSEKETVQMHGADIQLRGENGLIYSAIWTWNDYSFAINADTGLSKDVIFDAIEEMVTVVG